jgi:hypothetical protein
MENMTGRIVMVSEYLGTKFQKRDCCKNVMKSELSKEKFRA